jgi:hypothetical protein
MDVVPNFKFDAENYVERRCCGKYKVWVPAQPESLVAVKVNSTIFNPDFFGQAVNGI